MKAVVGVPGPWKDHRTLVDQLAQRGGWLLAQGTLTALDTKETLSVEVYQHDPRMRAAFVASARGGFDEAALDAIGGHTMTVYLIDDAGGTPASAARLLRAAGALVAAGGLGMKVESAGLAHPPSVVRELAAHADSPLAQYTAFVTFVRHDDQLWSCGMHHLGLPDVVVTPDGESAREAAGRFLLYLLVDKPALRDGESFAVDKGSARFRLEKGPCSHYPPDDLFHNPFGVWRLSLLH